MNLPVSIVAGYLGSGKTSYINKLLASATDIRYAILVNDFGDLNIDAELIEYSTKNSIQLINGCVCCAIGDDTYQALENILHNKMNIDEVVLEASGIADAAKVKALVSHSPGFEVSETKTMVDVTRIKSLLGDKFVGAHVRRQLEYGDQLILTKVDLLSAREYELFQQWFLGLGFSHVGVNSDSVLTDTHPTFSAAKIVSFKAVSRRNLIAWLATLDAKVLRLKGFVYLREATKTRFLLQWVDATWTLEAAGDWTTSERTRLMLVTSGPVAAEKFTASYPF